jgi:hypothetical protein
MPHHSSPVARTILISGGDSYGRRNEPRISVADLHNAIEAHGGNQTAFARDVLGFKDGRQVRRYLAGARMAWEPARKLSAHLKETQGTLNMFPKGKRAAK